MAAAITIVPQSVQAQAVDPWTETVVSVRDLGEASRLFLELGKWHIVGEDQMDESEIAYWQLPEGASGRYRLVCAPAVNTGCIRFIALSGVGRQTEIRRALRPWDTGGIYSIMARTDDVLQLYEDAINMGWWAESPPIHFQFGTSDLRNVVLTGPHGIHLAVYERISPDFTEFPVGRVSQAFSSMRMVRDRVVSRNFFHDKLGFKILFDSTDGPQELAYSNLSIPYNYTTEVRRAAAALQPREGLETGRVELMQITGFTGYDVSELARLPQLGIISVRYPVENLDAYRTNLELAGVQIVFKRDDVVVDHIGTINIIAIRDPDGSITEFYERPAE